MELTIIACQCAGIRLFLPQILMLITMNVKSFSMLVQVFQILSNGDLAIFHFSEEAVNGTYHCVARTGPRSAIIATYAVVDGEKHNTKLYYALSC